MYVMRYFFPLKGFIGEMSRYYQLCPGQLHLNELSLCSYLISFFRLVGIEPIINVFRSCYHLVADTDYDNDMCWFFTLANMPTRAINKTLCGKPVHVKKWRGKWLIVRYSGPVNPRGGMQQIWGCFHYWKVSLPDVNNMSRLSLDEEKTYAALASTLTKYKVNRMAKRYY